MPHVDLNQSHDSSSTIEIDGNPAKEWEDENMTAEDAASRLQSMSHSAGTVEDVVLLNDIFTNDVNEMIHCA